MNTVSVEEFVAVTDALDGIAHALADWSLWTQEPAPEASRHLLRAVNHVHDAARVLSRVDVEVVPAAMTQRRGKV